MNVVLLCNYVCESEKSALIPVFFKKEMTASVLQSLSTPFIFTVDFEISDRVF